METRKLKNNFRAWFKPDFETKDGPLKFNFVIEESLDAYFACEGDEVIRYPMEVPWIDDEWIIERSTGLFDVNGFEVFEGDILSFDWGPKCLVEWISRQNGYDFTGWLVPSDSRQMGEFEIIGNIHQNNLDGSPKIR